MSSCFLPRVAHTLSAILSFLDLPTQTFTSCFSKSTTQRKGQEQFLIVYLPAKLETQERVSVADDFHIFKSSASELNQTTKI